MNQCAFPVTRGFPLPDPARGVWYAGWLIVLVVLAPTGARADESAGRDTPSFDVDVMAVLSQAGCNAGLCHGNQNGKGGFRLSLRGQDPTADYASLTRQFEQRRIDRLQADQSLLLLKPTGQIAHEGGVRFHRDSYAYRTLQSWIQAGAKRAAVPDLTGIEVEPAEAYLDHEVESLPLRVLARFADGSQRDVTARAVYEVSNNKAAVDSDGRIRRIDHGESTIVVRYLQRQVALRVAFLPPGDRFQWTAPPAVNDIDRHVFARLRKLRVNPSPVCDDHVFARRAYLDLLGITPTADEARTFVADNRPDKRAELIDRLLARPELADHWALKWSDLLRNEEKVLDVTGVERFHGWIRDWMAQDKPLDQFVRELIVGQGSTYENPPANYYRANREPLGRGETTARLFLGYRLQCARCHNHPFDRWTQDDYYGWAALFARIDYKIVDNQRKDKFDQHEFIGEQIVLFKDEGEVTNPRTGQAAPPGFLDQRGQPIPSQDQRLERLSHWLTGPTNRQFARTLVNLVWYHMLGRGIVEPIDDFRLTNPPVNAELLEALTDDFIEHGYRLRPLLRRIALSHTYQASSEPNATNSWDQTNFSHAVVKRLTAEQLLDAQCRFLDEPARFAGYPPGIRAGQLSGVRRSRRRSEPASEGDRFLSMFGKPERLLACECERSNETTLAQTFQLVSGEGMNQRLQQPGGRIARLADSQQSPPWIVDQLYWEALSRPPTPIELDESVRYLQESEDQRSALEDLAWALLNCKEFVFRR
jgi:hypothetical protein